MATWDKQKQRWKASVGTGANRRFLWAPKNPAEMGCKGELGERQAEQLKREYIEGPAPCRPGSVNEFVQKVWWPKMLSDCSVETRRAYKRIFDELIEPRFGNHLLGDVSYEQVQEFAIWLRTRTVDDQGTKVKPKTVKNQFGVLQSIFKLAHRYRRIKENPTSDIELPTVVKRKARRGLNLEMLRALDLLFHGTTYEGPVWAAPRMMLRRNEVCGLRPQDVVLESDRAIINITVNRQPHETKEQLKNKVEGEARTLYVPRAWGEKLLSYHYPGAAYIFCNTFGRPLNPDVLTSMFAEKVRTVNLDIEFRELRNLGISVLARSGINLTTVADQVGHTTPEMTMIYLGLDEEASFNTFDAFSRLDSTSDHSEGNQ